MCWLLTIELTREYDGLNLIVVPHHPQDQTGQVQRVDELPSRRARTPYYQGLPLLWQAKEPSKNTHTQKNTI